MNWIRNTKTWLLNNISGSKVSDQQKLVLIVCSVSFIVTASALYAAELSGYLMAFILIILALLCLYAVVASKVQAEFQVRTLSNLIESMIDGDYSLRGRLQTNQAYQEVLNLINNLAESLAKHKIEAKESRLLLERIMEQMDAMVLATNEQGFVVMANASANKLLLGNVDKISDIKLSTTILGAKIESAQTGIVDFAQQQLKGEHFLFKESFLSEGKKHQLYLLTNAERLLMEKERNAWQSLLRVLSHEMNNSLTPIAAVSQSMQKKLAKDLDENNRTSLLEGVGIINERAESLSAFIASYSQLSHLPKPNKTAFFFNDTVKAIAALYPELNIELNQCENITIEADKHQFEQVLINLFKNSLEAMLDKSDKVINVSNHKEGQWQHIILSDCGGGIANLDNLFVPFYTTKTQGSGIGLALCRQIMFNHNGQIHIENNHQKNGVLVTLSLPLS